MNLAELKNLVMNQTNNDADDLPDFMPYLVTYLNDGYDRLIQAFANRHIGSSMFPQLRTDADVPLLPEWAHPAIADWATWLVYRNGNTQKQSRGTAFRASFSEIEGRLRGVTAKDMGAAEYSTGLYFKNIPV